MHDLLLYSKPLDAFVPNVEYDSVDLAVMVSEEQALVVLDHVSGYFGNYMGILSPLLRWFSWKSSLKLPSFSSLPC